MTWRYLPNTSKTCIRVFIKFRPNKWRFHWLLGKHYTLRKPVSKAIHFHMGLKVVVPLKRGIFPSKRGTKSYETMHKWTKLPNHFQRAKEDCYPKIIMVENRKKVITLIILFLQTCTKLRWRHFQHQHIFCYNWRSG